MLSDEDAERDTGDSVFSCKQCGECCIGYGGTFVTDQDIERISAYISVDPHGFVEKILLFFGGQTDAGSAG